MLLLLKDCSFWRIYTDFFHNKISQLDERKCFCQYVDVQWYGNIYEVVGTSVLHNFKHYMLISNVQDVFYFMYFINLNKNEKFAGIFHFLLLLFCKFKWSIWTMKHTKICIVWLLWTQFDIISWFQLSEVKWATMFFVSKNEIEQYIKS